MATASFTHVYFGTYENNTFTITGPGLPFSGAATDGFDDPPDHDFTVGEGLTGTGAQALTGTYVAELADGSGFIAVRPNGRHFLFTNTDYPTRPLTLDTLAIDFVTCFTPGTMILTPDGEKPVEALCPGQLVVSQVDGVAVPRTVKWVGHRRIDLTRHPRAGTMAPVRIERDAFSEGMPHRDLMVSQDHAIFVDGVLICAKQLVNGTTIRRERDWTAVDYYHVELDQHAILLAEGLPAESYLDTGNKGFFANSDHPMVLHPDLTDETAYPTREANSCAPFVTDEAGVRPVWERLAERAAANGRTVPVRMTTTAADLRMMAKGREIKPIYGDDRLVIFTLPRDAKEVRLVSRAQSPNEARPWLSDTRQLGVPVTRLVLRGADEVREVPVDHPDLVDGWWAVEHDGLMMSRWTDGEAVLPLPPVRGIAMLEVHLAGVMTYVVETAAEGEATHRAA